MPQLTRPIIRRLALLAAIVLLVGVALFTYWRGAIVRACDPELLVAEAIVRVDGDERAMFAIQRNATQDPIEVAPGQQVVVNIVLTPQPAGCMDAFQIDWELSFVVFIPHEVDTFSDDPLAERIEIMLGEQRPNPQGEDHIVVVIRDAAGQALRVGIIRLKGT